jgi:ElaB/YqjD/DUF883 family membrane-anchored ribosome-binding protein
MNYTKNYHLPQWDENDRVMRADFNQMCADMENGLLKTARDAAEDTAQASANADKAQATANKAVADAAAAQATANAAYCPSNKPYVIGTYTGTDAEQTVTVGFQPGFLIVVSPSSRNAHMYTMASGKGLKSARLELTSTGFKLFKDGVDSMTNTVYPPIINAKGGTYVYIAFR